MRWAEQATVVAHRPPRRVTLHACMLLAAAGVNRDPRCTRLAAIWGRGRITAEAPPPQRQRASGGKGACPLHGCLRGGVCDSSLEIQGISFASEAIDNKTKVVL